MVKCENCNKQLSNLNYLHSWISYYNYDRTEEYFCSPQCLVDFHYGDNKYKVINLNDGD
jgi:hypothetical protein